MNIRSNRRKTRQNRSGKGSGLLICLVLLLGEVLSGGRTSHAAGLAGETGGQFRDRVRGEVRREITDPCLGQHWQLVVDSGHPGWPARMVLLNQNGKQLVNRVRKGSSHAGPAGLEQAGLEQAGSVSDMQSMVIRAGDRVTVDQDSDVLRARFEAVALESAGRGEMLRVRLIVAANRLQGLNSKLTAPGPVIAVVATGIGLARWNRAGQVALGATDRPSGQATDRTGRTEQ
jgi:hypothetical protein